jgi:hypothetical protein
VYRWPPRPVPVPVPRPRLVWTNRLKAGIAIWIGCLASWLPAAAIAVRSGDRGRDLIEVILVALGVGVIATLVIGWTLGRRSMWRHLRMLVWIGTVAVIWSYVIAMIGFNSDSDTTSDNAAGAGVAIFGVPIAVTIAALLFGAAGLSCLTLRRPRSHRPRS